MRLSSRFEIIRATAIVHGLQCSRSLQHLIELSRRANFDPDQPRDDRGRWVSAGGSVVTVERRTRTGNPDIDDVTDQLTDLLGRTMAKHADGFGPTFGTSVHLDFAQSVRAADIQSVGAISVEQSFGGLGDVVRYGADGSIRTDVTLHFGNDPSGAVIAIWDVKTGNASLTQARVDQIRSQLQLTPDVPIIQLHADGPPTVKHLAIGGKHVA